MTHAQLVRTRPFSSAKGLWGLGPGSGYQSGVEAIIHVIEAVHVSTHLVHQLPVSELYFRAHEMSNRSPVGTVKESSEVKLSDLKRPKSARATSSGGVNLNPATKTRRKGSPIMHKLVSLFKRNPEEGVVPVRPSCFDDDRYQRRSESPEAVDGGKRRNSNSNTKQHKIKKKEKQATRMWRPKVGLSVGVISSISVTA